MKTEHRRSSSSGSGFTMIEVIAVLIIMGIVSVVVVSRMAGTDNFDLTSQVEVVKNHLRYAQVRAMNTDTEWGVHFNPTSYYLFQGDGSITPVIVPGENSPVVDLANKGSNLTITPPTGGRVTFDTFGSPGPENITIITNGDNITVTRNTGFIP